MQADTESQLQYRVTLKWELDKVLHAIIMEVMVRFGKIENCEEYLEEQIEI